MGYTSFRLRRSELYRDTGRVADAETLVQQVIPSFRQGEYALGLLEALTVAAECAIALGHDAAATEALMEAKALLPAGEDWGRLVGLVALAEAALLLAQGNQKDAEACFTEALTIFERLGLQWDVARSWYLWGAPLRGPRSPQQLHQAERAWREMGAQSYAAACQHLLNKR